MPLLRLNEVSRRILTFAAGCRSYGSMRFPAASSLSRQDAVPTARWLLCLFSPSPLLPCSPAPLRFFPPVIPANEARPESGCLCSGSCLQGPEPRPIQAVRPFRPCFRLRIKLRRTGKVCESENDGFSLRSDLLPVGHSPDEAEGATRRLTSYISYCRNHASGQGCPSYGSMRFPLHILTFAAGCRSYGLMRFPLHILTFAARCRSYGSMVALPFSSSPPAPPLPYRRRRRIPARAEWIASDSGQAGMTACSGRRGEARPKSVLIGVRRQGFCFSLLTSNFSLLPKYSREIAL